MPHLGIISLGSNQGNRLEYLQQGIQRLIQSVGVLERLSPIYETPALGFEGADFLNACASFQTRLSPQDLMQTLLDLELDMGRQRSQTDRYESRTLDLDLLFYDEEQVDTTTLVLPHPRLHLRNFVLYPLADIHPEVFHPEFGKTVAELRQESKDSSSLQKQEYAFWTPPIFEYFQTIVFEGNIGVGKTTLTQKVAEQYQVPARYEAFQKNPHLSDFYSDPQKHALAVESFFLNDRLEQLQRFQQKSQPGERWVADYGIQKSLIFAQVNLGKSFAKFQNKYQRKTESLSAPKIWVYLQRPVAELLEHIRNRKRDFEQNIGEEYLLAVEQSYQKFIREQASFKVIEIAAEGIDYTQDEEAFQRLLFTIYAH